MAGIENEEGWLKAIEFEDETTREYAGIFAVYGFEYNTDLAEQLGCDLNDNGTVDVGEHG